LLILAVLLLICSTDRSAQVHPYPEGFQSVMNVNYHGGSAFTAGLHRQQVKRGLLHTDVQLVSIAHKLFNFEFINACVRFGSVPSVAQLGGLAIVAAGMAVPRPGFPG
jgi:hypothetical protein